MERSSITKTMIKFTVRPIRIPILVTFIALVYRETGIISLTLMLTFMSLVFDMLFVMLTEQFRALTLMHKSLETVGLIMEEHEESINDLEMRG